MSRHSNSFWKLNQKPIVTDFESALRTAESFAASELQKLENETVEQAQAL